MELYRWKWYEIKSVFPEVTGNQKRNEIDLHSINENI